MTVTTADSESLFGLKDLATPGRKSPSDSCDSSMSTVGFIDPFDRTKPESESKLENETINSMKGLKI